MEKNIPKRKTTILIVEDLKKFQRDPFVPFIKQTFPKVIFKETTSEALLYINDNLVDRTIILLDISFSENGTEGIDFLKDLRRVSKIIPVIIWSGADKLGDDKYQEIINDTTFAFLPKDGDSEEMLTALTRADDYLNSRIDSAIEVWLENHSDYEKNKKFLAVSDGRSYSMNDLLREIRMQTPFGQSLSMDINQLTLDLLFRNKEHL